MLDQTNANIERHIKTHTERSDDDRSAVSVLETFLRSNGRINTSFASDDKWPNHDDTFEFVPNPDISRRPKQAFYVQIKGTRNYTEREGAIKYTLKDLAFPAFICGRVSLDPGILFVILNPAERGDERVFWKYMSPSFLNSIDFAKDSMDEVILCLNYDGKFGLNNMNSYFQNANTETAVVWRDWKYKVGDHILFNDTDRFSLLYNNLKGQIVQIELFDSRIIFTVDVEIPLTEQDCQNDGIEFIDIIDDVTRIRFDVLDFEEEMADEDRKKAIVPFQLAYAVSIHKAQGLEYRSVKVVIPSSNAEKITHGIFYTAITRAKEKLKIYWSSETMQEVVAGFSVDTSRQKSLAIIKEKLKQDKNT